MKIKDLKKVLEKYDEETEVCSGYITEKGMIHLDLMIKETNPIGDRDTEEQLLLWLGCKDIYNIK
jgi:hypothetical protein